MRKAMVYRARSLDEAPFDAEPGDVLLVRSTLFGRWIAYICTSNGTWREVEPERPRTAAEWVRADPVLPQSVCGLETDTDNLKIGDGVTPWNELLYTDKSAQTYGRWFTDYPSTHVRAGQSIEVMPVDEHLRIVADLRERIRALRVLN